MAAPARKSQLFSTSVVKEIHSAAHSIRGPAHKTMFSWAIVFSVTLSFHMLLARSTAHVGMSCPALYILVFHRF